MCYSLTDCWLLLLLFFLNCQAFVNLFIPVRTDNSFFYYEKNEKRPDRQKNYAFSRSIRTSAAFSLAIFHHSIQSADVCIVHLWYSISHPNTSKYGERFRWKESFSQIIDGWHFCRWIWHRFYNDYLSDASCPTKLCRFSPGVYQSLKL